MDSDSDMPQETDSSGEGEDDDLSHLGAAQTTVKSFAVKQESYQMVERGSNRLVDTVLRSCPPAGGTIDQTSQSQVLHAIRQPAAGSSTNIIQQNFLQVHQQFGDVTVEGARNLTIGGTQNIGKAGPSQEGEKLLTWTEKIRERTKSRIEEWTHGMVKTSALTKVMTKLTSGATWVTIKGSPGEGKTTTAYMALEELHRSERQVFQVLSPDEFSEVTATCPKPVILLDDILGNLELDLTEWTRWKPVLYQVLGAKEHRSHEKETEKSQEKEVTVILVGRDYVLNSASTDMGRISDYFTRDEHVVYMSHAVERDIQEKLAIWKAISEASGIELDEKTIDTICKMSIPHGFPHVCRLFVTMHKEDSNINAESFYKAPLQFLNQTVEKFMKDKVKLALFKEIIKRNGSVNIRDLGNVDNTAEIIEIADNLVGTYLSKEDGSFTFNHPSIYDSVAFNLCKKFPLFVIENCHLSFLHERLRLESSHDTGHESSLVVNIPRCFIVDLAKRFAAEIENRNLRLVLSHKALTDQLFIEELLCCVKLPLVQLLKLTDKQIDHSFLSLISSNKSTQLLKYIDNQTDIQLTEREINTLLYGVCKYAASDVLTYLVQSRDTLDINVRYEYGKTPLMIASETRDIQFVQQIMSLGPDLKARDLRDKTILHYLCENGLTIAAKQVADRGTNIDVKDNVGRSPLFYACMYKQADVARLMVIRGASFDAETVVEACRSGILDVVNLLYERGATVNMITDSHTPLTAATVYGHEKVMRFLINKSASLEEALYRACDSNKPHTVQYLLKHGPDINSRRRLDNTPLHAAAWRGSEECVNILLKAGADVNVQNIYGETPLYIAAKEAHSKCVDVLLKTGADVNTKNADGYTPLHTAAGSGSTGYVNAFLEAGAVIDTVDRQGQTPLHKAVYYKTYSVLISLPDIYVCQTLIRQGAVINKQDANGNTPLHLLCQVDSHTKVDKNYPPQSASVYKDAFRRLVNLLIDHGADREIKNNRGDPALHGWCKTLSE